MAPRRLFTCPYRAFFAGENFLSCGSSCVCEKVYHHGNGTKWYFMGHQQEKYDEKKQDAFIYAL